MNTYAEIVIRTCIAYFALLVLTRLTGRREINQMTFPDFVSALAIGTVAGSLSIGPHRTIGMALLALVLWTVLTVTVDIIALKSRRLRVLFEGGPTVVIHNGKLLEDRMRQLRYSIDDVLTLLRQRGIFDVANVEFAIVETSGKLSVLEKAQHRPVTPADLAIPTSAQGMSVTLISDGEILGRNLRIAGLTAEWLLGELAQRGISPAEVFFAQLDSAGNLYIDLRTDSPCPENGAGWSPPPPCDTGKSGPE